MVTTRIVSFKSALFAGAVMAMAGGAHAGGVHQHSAASVGHSVTAASHGSAAALTSAASVVAVPVLLSGEAATAVGTVVQEVGAAAASGAGDVLEAADAPLPLGVYVVQPSPAADPAPTLD